MIDQEEVSPPPEHYGVLPIVFDEWNPPYITHIGNQIYISLSSCSPSQLPSNITADEYILDRLEASLTALKLKCEKRADVINSTLEAGKEVSRLDQEWMDDGGNFIDEQLLINRILVMEEDTPKKLSNLKFRAFNTLAEKAKMIKDSQYSKKMKKRQLVQPNLLGKKVPYQLSALKKADGGKRPSATFEEKVFVMDWYHANGKNQSKT